MEFFTDLVKSFVDPVETTKTTIEDALEKIAIELQCSYKDFFVSIQPINEDLEFKLYIYSHINGQGAPKFVREITVKEIVSPSK